MFNCMWDIYFLSIENDLITRKAFSNDYEWTFLVVFQKQIICHSNKL